MRINANKEFFEQMLWMHGEFKLNCPNFLGADFDTAKQALTANNFNLEQAINYHLERSHSIGAPEDDVAGTID